jgi:hypothetical protein
MFIALLTTIDLVLVSGALMSAGIALIEQTIEAIIQIGKVNSWFLRPAAPLGSENL